jgi:hypothetical protein
MFLNTPVRVFDAISNSSLTSINNELYENGIRIATETDTDTLQTEIDELGVSVNTNTNSINSLGVIVNTNTATINSLGVAVNTNTATINSLGVAVNTNTANISTLQSSSLVTDTPLVTPSAGSIIFSDGINPIGTNTDSSFTYQVADNQNFLTVGAAQVISSNNNMKLESTDYILTTKDFYLQGTEDVQRYLTIGRVGLSDNVKTSVDITTSDYICDNQLASKTQWKGASEYDFDNDVKIGDISTNKKLYLNDVEITPSGSGGLSAGVLRALNINQIIPTVAQTYDIVWSNLSPAEQAIWAGGSEPPVASATGNYWNFTKLVAGTQKINWTLPFDFLTANLSFQDLLSVYAIVRLNTSSNISAEGYMWFQIQSQNTPQDAPLYRTRWNYANSASGIISQLGNTYKIYASDAIPLSTAASNTGKGQEVYPLQTKFKSNPVDVEPTSLFSIPFTKFVMSPTGDTTSGYTSANVQSIALNTASNINTYNFDLIAIGFNSVRYNLFYA